MAWSAPRTWVHAEIVSAAIMNTHVRDNLLETAPGKATLAGQTVYALAANSISMQQSRCTKAGDTSVTSASLSNDNDFTWAVVAGERWAFRQFSYFTAASPVVATCAFSVPAGSTGWLVPMYPTTSIGAGMGSVMACGAYAIGSANTFPPSVTVAGILLITEGVVIVGSTGFVIFQFASNGAINLTHKAGSYIDLKRLA